jgi:hypothetical protein
MIGLKFSNKIKIRGNATEHCNLDRHGNIVEKEKVQAVSQQIKRSSCVSTN